MMHLHLFVRHRMTGLVAGEIGNGVHHMVILGDHNTVFDPVAPKIMGGLCSCIPVSLPFRRKYIFC